MNLHCPAPFLVLEFKAFAQIHTSLSAGQFSGLNSHPIMCFLCALLRSPVFATGHYLTRLIDASQSLSILDREHPHIVWLCRADVGNHGLTMVQLLLAASFLLPPPVVTAPTLQGREKKCEQFHEWAPIDAELHPPCFLGLLFAFILGDCSADVKHI